MIDLGTDDAEAREALDRALSIIDEQVAPIQGKLQQPKPTSEIARLHNSLPTGPLNIINVLEKALVAGSDTLQQISILIGKRVPTSPTVLQSLLRTAIISSARLVHTLLPADPETRLANARVVLALDAQSGTRATEIYSDFQSMRGVRAPDELVDRFKSQLQELYPAGRVPGEGAGVRRMVAALSDAFLAADLRENFDSSLLTDHAQWLWNTYSGLAHAYMWPHLMWRRSDDPRVPGDYPIDLYMTANSFYIGQLAHEKRAEHDTAGSNTNVSLS